MKEKKYVVINKEELKNRSQYEWFDSFSNPCYGMNVKMDVGEVVRVSKEKATSFFINVLYLVVKGLDSVEEMRMRQVDGEIRLYESINPGFTVMTENGFFVNAGFAMADGYTEFYDRAKKAVEENKKRKDSDGEYSGSDSYDEYYITCLPWLSYESMTHPLCDGNAASSSCPRVCWDKYRTENGKTVFVMNITVSHCFVDGKRLSDAFIKIQDNFYRAEELLK